MNEYFFLGELVSIKTSKGKFDFPPKGYWLVADSENVAYLLGVPTCYFSESKERPKKRTMQKYFDFNGKNFNKIVEVEEIDIPIDYPFAKAINIVYKSNKLQGGGDGKLASYLHKFGTNVVLYWDSENLVYLIGGGNLTVNERGIVN